MVCRCGDNTGKGGEVFSTNPWQNTAGQKYADTQRTFVLTVLVDQGNLGNLEKSGALFSRKAFFPSLASSVR